MNRPWFEKYRPLWNAEAGAASGAAAGDAGAGAGSAAAAGEAAAAGGAAASGGSDAAATAAAAAAYRPEGLAETMAGKDDRETIDRLHAAVKGYRERDATRDVPEDVKGYLNLEGLKDFKLDDAMKPHFEALAADPAATAMFDRLKAHGVGRAAALDIWQSGMKALAEGGMLEPPVDPAVERGKLLPDSAKALPKAQQDAAIDARMQANEDFIKLLTKPGADGKPALDAKVADHALLMLMDTAEGNLFLESMRGMLTGGNAAQPLNAGSGAGVADMRASLQAELAAPEMNPQHPRFNRAAWDALTDKYRRAFGD